MTVNSVRHKWS